MAKTYTDALAEALNQQPITTSMSNQEIEGAIAHISAILKEPMSNAERLMLVADRAELRATLKQRNQ